MNYQIDQQFIQRTTTLVREVLGDEARFVYKGAKEFQTLHDKIFSKVSDVSFSALPPTEKGYFRKYFSIGGDGVTKRLDVEFADSPDDQALFFDQFRNQVKYITHNYARMDFLRPTFSDKADAQADFDESQTMLVLHGIVHPCLHALEQREIARLEKKSAASPAASGDVKTSANAFEGLGKKILVKGLTGQFDTVLTFEQIALIAEQEALLRAQGLDDAAVIKALQDFIQKRFPGLQLFLDKQGHIQTFLSGLHVSKDNPEGLFSFKDLLTEMKVRQGHQIQTQAIIASKGTLALSNKTYQVVNASGVTTTVSGLGVYVDKGGAGDNAVFFVQDNQGGMARVLVDTADLRLEKSTSMDLALYDDASVDIPGGPSVKLDSSEAPTLEKPLKAIYAEQSGEAEEYEIAGAKATPKLPVLGKKPDIPTIPKARHAGDLAGSSIDISLPPIRPKISIKVTPGSIPKPISRYSPPEKLSIPPAKSFALPEKSIMPKIPAGKPIPPKPQPGDASDGKITGKPVKATAKDPFPLIPVKGPGTIESNTPVPPPTPKKNFPLKALAITGGATIATVGSSLLLKFFS